MALEFKPAALEECRRIIAKYPRKRSAVLPVLYVAQREFGYVSEEAEALVAKLLDLHAEEVSGVVSFYTMFHRQPVGRYVVEVCRTLSCALMGADDIASHLRKRLGIQPGETTPDGRFTLRNVECLASCGTGPAVQINGVYHENLTIQALDRILDSLP
ncbi:MAG: NADH-quinone oxidoreductase subunit NuoE [Candidatus Eisenbacteria bacterium]|nr:NADH-quinone oxidoreductase subunit NuoE [Candidatus Eisenbacteria bacterium]